MCLMFLAPGALATAAEPATGQLLRAALYTSSVLPTQFNGGYAGRSVPAIVDVVLDASASVSESDFRKAGEAVSRFAQELYARSHDHPGERSDWLTVNWFGGEDEFRGTRWINCSNTVEMAALAAHLESRKHPKHDSTAIYSALAAATAEVREHDSGLPGLYASIVILVTDGQDNQSPEEIKQLMRIYYPDDSIILVIIGVGRGADVAEFESIADDVDTVDNFDALGAALIATLEVAGLFAP